MELLGIMSRDLNVTDWLLTRCSVYIRYWRQNGSIMGQFISCLMSQERSFVQLNLEHP